MVLFIVVDKNHEDDMNWQCRIVGSKCPPPPLPKHWMGVCVVGVNVFEK